MSDVRTRSFIWIELVRIIAIFGVVLIHVSSPFASSFDPDDLTGWWYANAYGSFFRNCVPLFFMLSGYLLLKKNEDLGVFFNKRFSKILIPFVFWSLFYLFWKVYVDHWEDDIFAEFKKLLHTPAYYHLWFLYSLVTLYFIVPVLRFVTVNSTNSILAYFLGGWFLAAFIIPILYDKADFSWNFDLRFFTGYSGYLVLGYYLGNLDIKPRQVLLAAFTFVVAYLGTVFGTHSVSMEGGYTNEYFYENFSITVFSMAASQFIVLKYWFERVDWTNSGNAIKALGGLAFGIYLIHPLIITILNQGRLGFVVDVSKMSASYGVPLVALLVFLLSAALTWALQKIPVIKKIVP